MSISILPTEADLPLVIYADTPLTPAIPLQGFQTITGWPLQRPQVNRRIEHAAFAEGKFLKVLRESSGKLAFPDGLTFNSEHVAW